jgi:hypothetical protein
VYTPGYRGLVQARGQTYVFHSDLEGKQVRLAPLSGGQSQQPVTTPTGAATPTAEATATTRTTAIPTASGTTIPDLATSTPTYTMAAQAPPRLVEELARLLKVGSQHLVIHNLQPIIWPNLCFDFKRKDTPLCNQIPTRGYQGSVTVSGATFGGDPQYEFHSNEKGDLLYVMPRAALTARQSLANQLDIQVGEIYFDRVEPWTWPNTCALTPTPSPTGEVCIEIQIPGWRVVLGANQGLYEFHTDTNGQVIQPIPAEDER